MARYNEGLKGHQGNLREETIKLIRDAIDRLGENAQITAIKLQKETNLSRSVLYKEHALKIWNPKLWEERYIEKSRIEKKLETKYLKDFRLLSKEIEELNGQIAKLQQKNKKLEVDLEKEKKRREVREMDYDDEKKKNQRLLAELQKLENELHTRS